MSLKKLLIEIYQIGKSKMRILRKLIINILLYPMYIISLFIPKSKNIWVFGSWFGNSFSDNSRYLYEHVVNNEKKIIPIWLTKNQNVIQELRSKNLKCYHINSIRGFYYTARSKVIIVSQGLIDINKMGISNQTKVLLWHGTPMKKIAYDDQINAHSYNKILFSYTEKIWNFFFPFDRENWALITASSEEVKNKFITAFKSNINVVKVTGYPRYDIILSKKNLLKFEKSNKKLVLYAPTFRDNYFKFDFFKGLNLKKLELILEQSNATFIVNVHPKLKLDENIFKKYNNIIINNFTDVNILLAEVDILLTDYSSIYFDFLLKNRPIIFTPFDYDDYINNNRKFYYKYSDITPGKKCNNWHETLIEIQNVFDGNDLYMSKRQEMKKIFHKYEDLNNCNRIINRIKKYETK